MAGWDKEEMPGLQQTAAASRESHTTTEITRLKMTVEELAKTVHVLEERLAYILRGAAPASQPEAPKEKENLVPLADAIRQMRQSIARSTEQMADIMRRLEL